MTPRLVLPATLLLLTGCGSTTPREDDPGTRAAPQPGSADLAGEYVGHVPGWPDGTEIRLTLGDGTIGFRADCNEFSGDARWKLRAREEDSGDFRAQRLGGTEMGCAPEAMERDQWMVDFFSSADTIALSGTDVALRAGSREVWFVPADEEAEVEPPAVDLVGTTWRLTGIEETDGDMSAMTIVPEDVDATLSLERRHADFTMGCNEAGADFTVEGDRLVLGEAMVTQVRCLGAVADVENAILRVLGRPGDLTWSIAGRELTLRTHDQCHALRYVAN